MIRNKNNSVDDIHYYDEDGKYRKITYVYHLGRKLWELIEGFLLSKDGYSLQSKDGYILKAKDQ